YPQLSGCCQWFGGCAATDDAECRQGCKGSQVGMNRLRKFLVWGGIASVLAYAVLRIPERTPPAARGAGRQPFLWKQDAVWSELETAFNQAKTAGCESIRPRIGAGFIVSDKLIQQLSVKALPRDDPVFAEVKTNLFGLEPLIAACPKRMTDYIQLVTRLRSEVKLHSQHWNLDTAAPRQRLYRLLFGSRMALEEVILQAPASNSVPQLILAQDVSSQTPAISVRGVRL